MDLADKCRFSGTILHHPMTSAASKVIAVLLLIAQAAAGVFGGRVACVPIPHDDRLHAMAHDADAESASFGHVHDCHESASQGVSGTRCPSTDQSCFCHAHVPEPSEERLPAEQHTGSGNPELRLTVLPVALARASACPLDALAPGTCLTSQSRVLTDNVRALKAVRLQV